MIKSQSEKIEFYLKVQQESLSKSTTSSFYEKNSSVGPCTKCDELRKTVFKLNSQLTKSGSRKEVAWTKWYKYDVNLKQWKVKKYIFLISLDIIWII